MDERLPVEIERKLGVIKTHNVGVIAEKNGKVWQIYIGGVSSKHEDMALLNIYLDEKLKELK